MDCPIASSSVALVCARDSLVSILRVSAQKEEEFKPCIQSEADGTDWLTLLFERSAMFALSLDPSPFCPDAKLFASWGDLADPSNTKSSLQLSRATGREGHYTQPAGRRVVRGCEQIGLVLDAVPASHVGG